MNGTVKDFNKISKHGLMKVYVINRVDLDEHIPIVLSVLYKYNEAPY
jgi:hypothetical protein